MKGLVRYQVGGGSTPTTTGVTFQKTRISSDLVLTDLDAINQNDYIYCNEPILLESTSSISVNRSATPTTVVASAYSTEGNGGRKLVRLSNGWLVSVVYDSTNGYIRYYWSKDNGANWLLAGYKGCWTGGNVYYGLSSNGTKTHLLFTQNIATSIYCFTIDMLIANGGDLLSLGSSITVDSSQSSFGTGCSITTDSNGVIHAAWCSRNASYPNSYNVRYSKSIDGGLTWATPIQITSDNTASFDNTYPCIIIQQNGNPIITYGIKTNSTLYYISSRRYNGASWETPATVYSGSSNYQNSPTAIIDSSGAIHVSWLGAESGNNQIYYSKSIDNGTTWEAKTNITSGLPAKDQPAITVDMSNNVYVFWYQNSGTYNQIYKKVFSGGSWGSIVQLTSATSGHQNWPQACANYTNFTEPLITWQDTQTSTVKFRGTWTDHSIQLIPSIEQTYSSDQIKSSFDGTLRTYLQTDVKKYEGFASPTKIGTVIDSYTKLLLHMDGSNGSTTFTDSSAVPKQIVTSGNAQISTAASKFGGASGHFQTSSDIITIPDNMDFSVGSSDFTVDFWIKINTTGVTRYICGQINSAASASTGSFGFSMNSNGTVNFVISSGSTNYTALSSAAITSTSVWTHLAGVRQGADIKIYVNGVLSGTTAVGTSSVNDASTNYIIGRYGDYIDAGCPLNGYIDEFRFTKGIARWTSNFTPPTSPYSITS